MELVGRTERLSQEHDRLRNVSASRDIRQMEPDCVLLVLWVASKPARGTPRAYHAAEVRIRTSTLRLSAVNAQQMKFHQRAAPLFHSTAADQDIFQVALSPSRVHLVRPGHLRRLLGPTHATCAVQDPSRMPLHRPIALSVL